jgi:hypothetical protein
VDWSDAEGGTAPGAVAVGIEPFRGFLHAERAGCAIPVQIELEDEPNGFGFDGILIQLLLDPLTAPLRFNDLVAERRRCAIPESLPRRLSHGSRCIFGYFPRGVLVEGPDNLSDQDLTGIVSGGLRDRDHLDVVLA